MVYCTAATGNQPTTASAEVMSPYYISDAANQ